MTGVIWGRGRLRPPFTLACVLRSGSAAATIRLFIARPGAEFPSHFGPISPGRVNNYLKKRYVLWPLAAIASAGPMHEPRKREDGCSCQKDQKGEKRPADVVDAAIAVAKIATGEVEENVSGKEPQKAPADKNNSNRKGSLNRSGQQKGRHRHVASGVDDEFLALSRRQGNGDPSVRPLELAIQRPPKSSGHGLRDYWIYPR